MKNLLFRSTFALMALGAAHAAHPPILDTDYGGLGDGIARVGFDIGADQDDHAAAATILADGRLALAGTAEQIDGQYDYGFARLTAAGQLDPGFGPFGNGLALAGLAPVNRLADLAQTADRRLLYVGNSSDTVSVIGRRLDDGSSDAGFNGNGVRFFGAGFFVDGGTQVALARVVGLSDGRILAIGYAGSSTGVCAVAVRLNTDASTDTTFGTDGSGRVCIAPATSSASVAGALDFALLADGRILLAGTARHVGGSGTDMFVARLLPNGALDTSFGPNQDGWAYVGFDQGGDLYDAANAIDVGADGRIVLAGNIATQDQYDIGVARLLPDGSADATFGLGGRVRVAFDLGGWNSETAHSVQMLADRRVLVGGWTQVNATVGVAVMLKPDGTPDARFGDAGKFVQADPNGPESAILQSERQRLHGDHLYLFGSIVSPTPLPGGLRNVDFAATRYIVPLFADDFEGTPD